MTFDVWIIAILAIACVALCVTCWLQDDRIDELERYIEKHRRWWDHPANPKRDHNDPDRNRIDDGLV